MRFGAALGFLAALGIAASVSSGREAPGNYIRTRTTHPTIGAACTANESPSWSKDLGRQVWCIQSKWVDMTPGGMGAPWKLRNTLTKFAAGALTPPTLLRVMISGDSVAGHIATETVNKLMLAYGDAGFETSLGTPQSSPITQTAAGDADCNPTLDYTVFFTGTYCDVGVGGTVTAGKGGGYVHATTMKFLYLKEPGAGTFDFQTQTLGSGSWDTQSAGVSASAASRSVGVVTVTLAQNAYKVRVTGVTGRVKFIGVSFVDGTNNGVVQQYLAKGGLAWNDATSTPRAIMDGWLAVVKPDLVLYESKEDPAWYATALETWWDEIYTANSLVDVIAIGSTPQGLGHTDADQLAQNVQLRNSIVSRGGIYWDNFIPQVNYATAVAYAWMDGIDGVHQQALGSRTWSDLFWSEFFSGLGSLPEARPVRNESVTTEALTIRYDAANASGLAGGYQTFKVESNDTSGFGTKMTIQRELLIKDFATGTTMAYLAPTDSPLGYTTNTLPEFRTQGRNSSSGVRVDGPWLHARSDGNAIVSASDGVHSGTRLGWEGIMFRPVAGTLPTCASAYEGEIRWETGTGANTGNPTRICACQSSGANNYAWRNLFTGTLGTTTACAN